MARPDWWQANHAVWEEWVGIHLGPRDHDLGALRAGRGRLTPIEDAELPPLAARARFVEADVHGALQAVPSPHGFDRVFVTWGGLCWLPEIPRWAGPALAAARLFAAGDEAAGRVMAGMRE